jgi:hypothetical protein
MFPPPRVLFQNDRSAERAAGIDDRKNGYRRPAIA